jgi:ElaB/YqjD/DUF883 family membrane-anchored ribosome-binding protein
VTQSQSQEVQLATLSERVRNLSAYLDAVHKQVGEAEEELKEVRAELNALSHLRDRVSVLDDNVKSAHAKIVSLREVFDTWMLRVAGILGGGAVIGWMLSNWSVIERVMGKRP